MVPTSRGNLPRGAEEGSEAPSHGPLKGKKVGDVELRKRLNETAADSRVGEADAGSDVVVAVSVHRYRLVKEAYRRTRKDGATGVDGTTADEYAMMLDEHLAALLARAKCGSYRAPPVRRAHIPKGDGDTRPIGIPTFEDKVLQRAAVMALEPLYEQEFFDCSYGFRPKRGVHDALASFWDQAMTMAGGWVLEVDIRKFFDTLNHKHLHELLRRRVADGCCCASLASGSMPA